MSAGVMKVEVDSENCCICGNSGLELLTPEEHDANSAALHVPLRTMLLQLNNNKVVPDGRICQGCATRAADAYEFSAALNSRGAPPLSEKIRALRRRLHELTQKIDVFIVVGGPGAGGVGGTNAYSEDDIIMVEKEALAAATAADRDDLEHARNARGDSVYQCTVCPISFQRVSELRAHAATHPADALHSCWTCGAQFPARDALTEHSQQHAVSTALQCNLCDSGFSSQAEMRRHEAEVCEARCPACGSVFASRSELSAHAGACHGRGSEPPLVCAACFLTFGSAELLSAHQLRHRQAKQFVCGYGDCVLRFGTRSNLMAHIRKCHAAELPCAEPARAPAAACDQCERTFGSGAALKRHQRVHQRAAAHQEEEQQEATEAEVPMDGVQYVIQTEAGEVEAEEGEVEYLEVETLEDTEYILEEVEEEETDTKPDISRLQ